MAAPPYTLGWVHNLKVAPPSSDAQNTIAVAVVFPVLSVLATGLRFMIRSKIVGSIGWDDIFIALSTLIAIGYSATTIYQTRWGLGLRATEFPPENAIPFSRVQYAGGPQYCLAVLGFKLSLLMSYLRVAGFNRVYATILYVAIAMVVISQLIFTFLLSVACHPIAKQWDPSIPGKCIRGLPTYFALAGTSLGWDLLIIILPFPILRRLQLDRRRKLAIGALYGLGGFFVTIVQAIRLRSVAKLATYTDSKPIIVWSIVEINLGVLVACVPAFGPLLKNFGKKLSHGYDSRSKLDTISRRRNRIDGRSGDTEHTDSDRKARLRAEDEVELWPPTNRPCVGESLVWHDGTMDRIPDTGVEDEIGGRRNVRTSKSSQQIHVFREFVVQHDNTDDRAT